MALIQLERFPDETGGDGLSALLSRLPAPAVAKLFEAAKKTSWTSLMAENIE